jgi:transcriptional regulator with XRE-family HTH domain
MQDTTQLRDARLAAGLTYREVGEAARLAPGTICHYESGRFNPSSAAISRWRSGLMNLLRSRADSISRALTQF